MKRRIARVWPAARQRWDARPAWRLPASLQHGAILSLGCMGNRVYTGLGEDEMYLVLRGKDLPAVAGALGIITNANAALNDYAKGRRQELATI